jgi:hypothetical protein
MPNLQRQTFSCAQDQWINNYFSTFPFKEKTVPVLPIKTQQKKNFGLAKRLTKISLGKAFFHICVSENGPSDR